jgi:hypothetical protein
MLFGREIDDPVWAFEGAVFRYEHAPDFHVLAFAGVFISPKIRGKGLFEHQGDTLAHDADGIDRIHERLDVGFEEIALNKPHHEKYQSWAEEETPLYRTQEEWPPNDVPIIDPPVIPVPVS